MGKANQGRGRAAERYRMMCRQLIAEPDADQKAVAKRLGISQGYLSKMAAEDSSKKPGLGVIESAIEGYGVSPQWFFDTRLTSPDFRQYVGPRTVPRVNYSALDRFLAKSADEPDGPTEEEIVQLERIDWDGEPTAATYQHYLNALRSVRRPTATVVKPRPKPKSVG